MILKPQMTQISQMRFQDSYLRHLRHLRLTKKVVP